MRLPGLRSLLCVSALFSLPLGAGEAVWPGPRPSGEIQLPNGRLLTPAGTQTSVGPYPFALADPAGARVVATVPTADHPCDVVFSPDGAFLYVAQANRNLVALLDVGARKVVRQISVALGPDGPGSASAESMPDGSTPNALALGPDGETLFVANAKGSGSRSNAKNGPDPTREASGDSGHIKRMPGSVSRVPVPSRSQLRGHTERAYRNRKPAARGVSGARASSVVPLSPDAEVSADGHNWSMAGYATDYTEKTWVPTYGGLGFSYDNEGGDPIAAPTAGYLWDAAARQGLGVRNYGEFVGLSPENPGSGFDGQYEGKGEVLRGNTCPFFPGFDTDILDNSRVDLYETNPDGAPMQAECDSWDFTREDATPEIPLNEAIWKSVRGRDSVMPPPVNAAFVTPAGREED